MNLRRARGTRVFPRLDLGGSSQSADGSRLEAWDPSTSHDSSHGETRVGRAGLRIEGKNDDTDVNLQGFDDADADGSVDAKRVAARRLYT